MLKRMLVHLMNEILTYTNYIIIEKEKYLSFLFL